MNSSEIVASLPTQAVTSIEGLSFPKVASGKVRELYDLGDALLMVATDRLSAFDVVLPDGIPGKGVILNQLSLWWFVQAQQVISHHVLPDQASLLIRKYNIPRELRNRSMVVRKLKPLPMECVVRGYLAGSGWLSYEKTGEVCGIKLDAGLRQAERLPEPLFTPTTKGGKGEHDEPISEKKGMSLLGDDIYREVQSSSLRLYALGRERASRAGMILADTKFEFGTDANGRVYLIDELLTPDSSRYWPNSGYAINRSPPSFDKQFVRDYLLVLDWEKTTIGISSGEATARLFELWKFSPEWAGPIRHHFKPLEDPDNNPFTALLHIASWVAFTIGKGLVIEKDAWTLDEAILLKAALPSGAAEACLEKTKTAALKLGTVMKAA